MINPLAVAAEGLLNGPLGTVTSGYLVTTTFVFKPKVVDEEDETGGKREVTVAGKFNLEQLKAIQREDEELIAIVTTIAKAIL